MAIKLILSSLDAVLPFWFWFVEWTKKKEKKTKTEHAPTQNADKNWLYGYTA